jgi:hypothetical protein
MRLILALFACLQSPVEKLRTTMDAWTSLEVRVSTSQHNDTSLAPTSTRRIEGLYEYIEHRDGRRWFREELRFDDAKPQIFEAYELNGKATRIEKGEIQGRPIENAVTGRDFGRESSTGHRCLPYPLATWYAGLRTLPDALESAKPEGETEVLGRPCDVYVVTRPTPALGATGYALDRETGIPLMMMMYEPEDTDMERPVGRWTADVLEPRVGLALPVRSHFVQYTNTIPQKAILREEITVEEIHFDREIPESRFEPVFGPQVTVYDEVKRKIVSRPASPVVTLPIDVGTPIVDARPDGSPGGWIVFGLVGGGLVSIVVALILRFRSLS